MAPPLVVTVAKVVPPVPNQAAAGPPAQVQLSDLTQAFSDAMQQVCDIERLQTQAASHTEQMAEQVGLVEALMARVAQLEEHQAITVQGNDADVVNFHLHQTVNCLAARLADLEAQGQQATTVPGNEADVEDDVLTYNLHQ